ncbi:MAG TPA: peptidoglycan-binding domain-containing protein, partial [Thermoanaerobaculia bacterium]|nr:peptidoglycan-binding domain-containing protein [Thermoanaerobaculia bacterium]
MAIRHLVAVLAVSVLAGCVSESTDEESAATTQVAEQDAERPLQARVPIDGYMEVDEEWLERGRLDTSWRSAADRDRQARRTATPAAQPRADADPPTSSGLEAPVERMRARVAQGGTDRATSPTGSTATGATGGESWESLSPEVFADLAPTLPVPQEGGGPTVLALQWMLDRVHFSPGVIDGRWGKNTEKAVYWLQDSVGLEATGRADRQLWDLLSAQVGADGPLRQHTVAAGDVEGPFVEIPEDPQEQADLDCLCYSSPSEALAERFHTTPDLLAQLNPGVDLDSISAGASLWVPAVEQVEPEGGMEDVVEKIVINRDGFYLHALDGDGE